MAIQTTYSQNLPVAVAGQLANFEPHRVISRELESATAAFGAIAVRGTGDHQVKNGSAGTSYLGVFLVDPTQKDGVNNYIQQDTTAIVTMGVVWVITAVAVVPGAQAYFDASGNITNVSTSNTIIPNGFFDSTAGIGALVKLRLK